MIPLAFEPCDTFQFLSHLTAAPGFEIIAGCLPPSLPGPEPTARDLAEAAIHTDPPRFLKRRALTRAVLAQHFRWPVAAVELGHDSIGAPFVVSPASAGLHLSVAGRGDLFALAFAPHRVGIDIEPLGQPVEPPWNILTAPERSRLRALPQQDRHRAFQALWTVREAELKAQGTGFAGAAQGGGAGIWQGWLVVGGVEALVACVALPREKLTP